MFSIIRQSGSDLSSVESRLAAQFGMATDVPVSVAALASLEGFAGPLRAGAVPVGVVEFIRAAMGLAGVVEPPNLSYPESLMPFLGRGVAKVRVKTIAGRWFVKPLETKAFTGFVIDLDAGPGALDFHDRAQYNAFLRLGADDLVWRSEVVSWQSEWRFYVIGSDVLGSGRYDDGPDDAPEPDIGFVREMAAVLATQPLAPAAYSLDVGVLEGGGSALIECNDAWALGYYRGSLHRNDYIRMLRVRWEQLLSAR